MRDVDSAGGASTDGGASRDSEATVERVRLGPEKTAAVPQSHSSVDVLATTGRDAHAASSALLAEFPVSSWDRYELISLIGRGGMGAVYKARDRRLDRIVALKFLRIDDPRLVTRFQREASTQARLDHPNICRVFEVGEVEHKPYIAMQFVDGKTLEQAAPELSLHEKVMLTKQVALALHEAHRLGIVHRDVKPSNIMIVRGSDGTNLPLVMDFGVAHETKESAGLTETGAVMGTPAYMAPEQARGGSRRVDRRADVYSLGATLFELLTGKPPFGGTDVVDVLLAVLSDEPRPPRELSPDVPRDLETIVLKCLAKDAGQRYDSARALSEDLQRYIDGEPILGKRASLLFRVRRQYRKHKALFAFAVVALVLISVIAGIGLRERLRSQRQVELAQRQAQLAQRLGQEISQMEWLLRSARQLELHDLEREKGVVRQRMQRLRSELETYGHLAAGLAHYAIGRGHLALHEYPQALRELRLAQRAGQDGAELHYALGIVLGKHYEQAMQEARLSGGGEWAKRQIKEIAPKYLQPAIASLERARSLQSDTPQYLEAFISFYQNDWDRSLTLIEEVQKSAPWLYEATKLAGDIHHERALLARDSGKYEIAEQEFAKAASEYERAAASGRSDAEIYEGHAETLIRQMEMYVDSSKTLGNLPEMITRIADRLSSADSTSMAGHMKKATAAMIRIGISGSAAQAGNHASVCLAELAVVLSHTPDDAFAHDAEANCLSLLAQRDAKQGQDPIQLLERASAGLVRVLRSRPTFVWGLNDLGLIKSNLATQKWRRGQASAREALREALRYQEQAVRIDETYIVALVNQLVTCTEFIPMQNTRSEIMESLSHADEVFARCVKINHGYQQCFLNYGEVYARAAQRLMLAGEDSQSQLDRARQNLATARKLGDQFLDLEQFSVLADLVDASLRLRRKESPMPPLQSLRAALPRCLALAKTDAVCQTLAAQGHLVEAEWLALSGKSPLSALREANRAASLATQSPEVYPDAWQVLAESNLRLAEGAKEPLRSPYVEAGLAALAKAFATNPNHAGGRATEGKLLLLAAASAQGSKGRALAQAALTALETSAALDPLTASRLVAVQARARELAASN